MNLRPLRDFVLVELIHEEKERPDSLIITNHGGIIQRDRVSKGKVLAVGPGEVTKKGVRVPCDAKVGETVWLPTKIDWAQGALCEPGGPEIVKAKDSQLLCAEERI